LIRNFRRPRLVLATVGVTTLALAGFGAGTAGAQGGGEVKITGSSTVEPITSLAAELFAEENPDASIQVDGPGTGDGFTLFCDSEAGQWDATDASRPIEDDEVALCEGSGIEYTELTVGIDGLTVVANPASKIKCLSFADLYAIFGPESGGGEVDLADSSALATELGGSQSPKSGTVEKFTPGPESGTYDSFFDITYSDIMEERLAAGNIPADKVGTNDEGEQEVTEPVLSAGQFPNDNDIVSRVEGSDNGIGFFGHAYYTENKEGLKAIGIENPETGKCVKPTAKTIQSGAYPISRELFVYVDNAKVGSNGTFKIFLDSLINKQALKNTVKEAGYVPLAAADITATVEAYKGVAG
jgi:phosphate transport system substrate-binding protein